MIESLPTFYITDILELLHKIFLNYIRKEKEHIYNFQTYITTFFFTLLEMLKNIQSDKDYEKTLYNIGIINMMCVAVKFLKEKCPNKIISIFFKLLEEVPIPLGEEEDKVVTLYKNYSYIYRTHFFNLYKDKCTTLYTKNCMEYIKMMRNNIWLNKKKNDSQVDFNNFIILSNMYNNSDTFKKKNIQNVLQYLNDYQQVYKKNVVHIFNMYISNVVTHKEMENGMYRKEGNKRENNTYDKINIDDKNNFGQPIYKYVDKLTSKRNTLDNSSINCLESSYVTKGSNTKIRIKDIEKIGNKLDTSNQLVMKSLFFLFEDKLGSYILQNDMNFSITKNFKQEIASYYIQSLLYEKNFFQVLFLLSNIYYSDVANKKIGAFSLFGKSSNVIHAENIRNTLILSMGLCMKKINSHKFNHLYNIREAYVSKEIFHIYLEKIYLNIAKENENFENILFDKNEKISKACYYKQMILLSYKKITESISKKLVHTYLHVSS
ncbi:hypothetical protein PFFVO_05890, partial [Plasmodium falciparum Vietnam Oak-Knoll (FVO)]